MQYDLIIIGAGASGLLAAVSAAKAGVKKIALLDSGLEPGRKLLLTGAGKCNFTNVSINQDCYPRGGDSQHLSSLLATFCGQDMIRYFAELGVGHTVDDCGRVYPVTKKSRTIISILLMEVERLGISLVLQSPVEHVSFEDTSQGQFASNGRFVVRVGSQTYISKALLLATGGKSYPSTGSDGKGILLAQSFGHTSTALVPVMVPLKCSYKGQKVVHGLRWPAVLSLYKRGNLLHQCYGDLMFNKKGITGLAVFELSAITALSDYGDTKVMVSLFPQSSSVSDPFSGSGELLTSGDLVAIGECLLGQYPNRSVSDVLQGFLPARLVKNFVSENFRNITPSSSSIDNAVDALTRAVGELSALEFSIQGTMGWPHAQVTAGGIPLEEVSVEFASKRQPGLWITGEMLDVHGICGGYNLHFAWASGIIAGRAIAQSLSQ